ncbi:MAG: hypothetical protein NC337_13875 [Roseburia sp.]|nr:hypothetical protein [Roseburia sp.]
MIYAEHGKEQDAFVAFVERALGVLAKEEYASFLSLFDGSRLTERELVSALRYLDERRPVLRVDDPAQVKCSRQDFCFFVFRDGSGYRLEYDLTTAGERNDLTLQVEFFKEKDRYIAVLDDLHTL